MNRVFKVTPALLHDLKKLGSLEEMEARDRKLVEGIGRFTLRTGKISFRQMQVLGRIYKRYLQDDQYQHHNWKIWR